MEIQYLYQKKRYEYGRQCLFSDQGPELIDNFLPKRELIREFIPRNPVNRGQQAISQYAGIDINTPSPEYANTAMNHIEGGWPKDINLNDEEQTKRYRRRVEKDDNYSNILNGLCKKMENSILQNNAINIYQQYFNDLEQIPMTEKKTANMLNVFSDLISPPRPINHISWSPDGHKKIAVTHCSPFNKPSKYYQFTHSFIWDIENPNTPIFYFEPKHEMTTIQYHTKDSNLLISGFVNGLVGVWDIRRGNEPVDISILENSFRDTVTSVLWINTKSGVEFMSGSLDGQLKWWDARKLSEPTETLLLHAAKEQDQAFVEAMGVCCLQYEPTIPTRFLVGTNQGYLVSGNRKGRTAVEKMTACYPAHVSAVKSIDRNPNFVKNFLTVGDFTCKIWSEDCKESPIMWMKNNRALYSDGVWSPTKISSYLTTNSIGILEIWDILQNQNKPLMAIKLCERPLTSLSIHNNGNIVAVGNDVGTLYIVELSENITTSRANEKYLLSAMLERETKREKILEVKNREIRLKQKAKGSTVIFDEDIKSLAGDKRIFAEDLTVVQNFDDDLINNANNDFFKLVNKELGIKEDTPEEIMSLKSEEVLEPISEIIEEPSPPPSPPPEPVKKEKKKAGGRKKKF